MMHRPLNPRQLRFIDEYLIDLNATQAYIRAGYSPNGADVGACRLLGDSRIQEAITLAQDKRGVKMGLSQEAVIAGLIDVVMSAKAGDPVLDGQGKQIQLVNAEGVLAPLFKRQRGHETKGYELLARHLGMFTEKVQIDKRPLEHLSDEELETELARLRKLSAA